MLVYLAMTALVGAVAFADMLGVQGQAMKTLWWVMCKMVYITVTCCTCHFIWQPVAFSKWSKWSCIVVLHSGWQLLMRLRR